MLAVRSTTWAGGQAGAALRGKSVNSILNGAGEGTLVSVNGGRRRPASETCGHCEGEYLAEENNETACPYHHGE